MKRTRLITIVIVALAFAATFGVLALRRGGMHAALAPVATAVVRARADRDVSAAFGKHRLNILILGNQAEEGTADTVILPISISTVTRRRSYRFRAIAGCACRITPA